VIRRLLLLCLPLVSPSISLGESGHFQTLGLEPVRGFGTNFGFFSDDRPELLVQSLSGDGLHLGGSLNMSQSPAYVFGRPWRYDLQQQSFMTLTPPADAPDGMKFWYEPREGLSEPGYGSLRGMSTNGDVAVGQFYHNAVTGLINPVSPFPSEGFVGFRSEASVSFAGPVADIGVPGDFAPDGPAPHSTRLTAVTGDGSLSVGYGSIEQETFTTSPRHDARHASAGGGPAIVATTFAIVADESGNVTRLDAINATGALTNQQARDVSSEGQYIVGTQNGGQGASFDSTHVFRWSEAVGFESIPVQPFPLPASSAYRPYLDKTLAISGDGSTIVGSGNEGGFIWREDGGTEILEFLGATDVNHDGSVIVGGSYIGGGAFYRWNDRHLSLYDLVDRHGLDLPDHLALLATQVSDDGRTIAGGIKMDVDGTYLNDAFVLRLDALGDATGDGRVDLADFTLLRNHFGQTDADTPDGMLRFSDGDFNIDGVVDLADFTILRNSFDNAADLPVLDAWHQSLVPEPAAAAALLLLTVSLRRRN
jgi:hypothetical protein